MHQETHLEVSSVKPCKADFTVSLTQQDLFSLCYKHDKSNIGLAADFNMKSNSEDIIESILSVALTF